MYKWTCFSRVFSGSCSAEYLIDFGAVFIDLVAKLSWSSSYGYHQLSYSLIQRIFIHPETSGDDVLAHV